MQGTGRDSFEADGGNGDEEDQDEDDDRGMFPEDAEARVHFAGVDGEVGGDPDVDAGGAGGTLLMEDT